MPAAADGSRQVAVNGLKVSYKAPASQQACKHASLVEARGDKPPQHIASPPPQLRLSKCRRAHPRRAPSLSRRLRLAGCRLAWRPARRGAAWLPLGLRLRRPHRVPPSLLEVLLRRFYAAQASTPHKRWLASPAPPRFCGACCPALLVRDIELLPRAAARRSRPAHATAESLRPTRPSLASTALAEPLSRSGRPGPVTRHAAAPH